jgi:hypothetical protein
MRKELAVQLLSHEVPALIGELLEAAADDLTPVLERSRLSTLEREADGDLRVIEAVERCKAVLDAVGLEALGRLRSDIEASEQARFAELALPRPPGWVSPDDLASMEVCTATGLGSQEVHSRLQLAAARTPGAAELRSRLRQGKVSLYRVATIQAEIAALPAECGPGVVEAVLRPKDGAPPSPTLFRQRLTRACLAADRAAAERRRAARRRRGAHARIDHNGLGLLTLVNDADKVIAAMERVDAIARTARQAGDSRDLDSLRADIITDTLMFGWPGTDDRSHRPSSPSGLGPSTGSTHSRGQGQPDPSPGTGGPTDHEWYARIGRRPAATVTLILPLTTALGLTDAPCELVGHGWVAADHARQIMLNDESTWRGLTVDAETGTALHLGTRAYRPTAAMRAHVEAVDGTCRGPGCTVPAARCDLDHDIPWPHGPTDVSNLTSKHRPHHNVHTHGHWQVRRDAEGRVHWRTNAGRTYVTHPKDWLEAVRDVEATPRVLSPTMPRSAVPEAPPF